jgi:hypothetical protein
LDLRLLFAGLAFLVAFASGIWLTRAGKPYSGFLLNAHKLVALAGIVLLALIVRQRAQAGALDATRGALTVVTGALLLASVATGGLVSVDRPMPRFVLVLHRALTFLSLIGSAAAVYLLLAQP